MVDAVVSNSLPPMWPKPILTRYYMWVEFVVFSRLCSEGLFSGFSGFPLSTKIPISPG